MLIRHSLSLALVGLMAVPALGQEPRRHVDAHAHGEGRLAIAIDGNKVEMQLETPASDIIGFEHAPTTAAQRKAIADAKVRLGKAATLFVLSPAAGCKLETANVEVLGAAAGKPDAHAGHSHGHSHAKAGKAAPADKATGGGAEASAGHSEFKVTYALTCTDAAKLGSIAFDYFKAFKRAEKLDVTVIGPKGQSSFAVTRAKPTLDLGGLS